MDKKGSLAVIIIIFLILGVIIGILVVQKYKDSKSFFTYKGLYGDYYIKKMLLENNTLYNVNVDFPNKRYIISLRNSPYDVENISLEPDIEKNLNRKEGINMLYVTKDPEIINITDNKATIAIIEFGRILGTNEFGIYKIPSQSANTKLPENNPSSTVPIVTCANVSKEISVIYVKLGNKNEVYSKNKCVIIEATDGDNLIKVADKFAYHLIGLY